MSGTYFKPCTRSRAHPLAAKVRKRLLAQLQRAAEEGSVPAAEALIRLSMEASRRTGAGAAR